MASFSRIFDRKISDGGDVGRFGPFSSLFNTLGAILGRVGDATSVSFVSEGISKLI